MSEQPGQRGFPSRTDGQILAHDSNMALIAAVAVGRVTREGARMNAPYLLDGDPLWTDLKRLSREDLLFAPISGPPTLQPRGVRLLAVSRGELPTPPAE